ncbi:hypothetical protein J1N35_019496 [Gossypium stocksii]|uniref:Retrotransposon Copia-like N-terminal domain-containing protein n=1 Tax=Gossypium stocksii TaxID=47602 RepID=A0A9D3VRE5_9ROSI|nr:hypothetical protein J1N35_019496 [Gossypium stocksii]
MALKDEGIFGSDKKTFSPYTLSPQHSPGNIITQVQLKRENYEEWARAVQTALRAKKKYGFIDGTVKQRQMIRRKLKIGGQSIPCFFHWVFNTIKPYLGSTISLVENVRDLWKDIRQISPLGMDRECSN